MTRFQIENIENLTINVAWTGTTAAPPERRTVGRWQQVANALVPLIGVASAAVARLMGT